MPDDVLGLSLHPAARYRPFALTAPGFAQVDQRIDGPLPALHHSGSGPVAPFATVEAEVRALDGAGVALGLTAPGGSRGLERLLVHYDPTREQVSVQQSRRGRTRELARGQAQLTAPFALAFVLCENQVTALVERGEGWTPLLTHRPPDTERVERRVDLRDPRTLGGLEYAFGAWPPGGEVRLGRVRAGPFGYTGLRDPHLVQHPDGAPYVRDGKAYLTWTCAGPGFFQAAHWGVFTLDLDDPSDLRQVAQLYSRRDGLLLGDHAGQLIVDEAAGRCMVAVSSWGDFRSPHSRRGGIFGGHRRHRRHPGSGVHVRYGETDANLLGGVHLLETEPLRLPTRDSSWDPALTRIDGRWYVAFVQSPSQDPFSFHPALAVGEPGGDLASGLRLVGADTGLQLCEGPILQQVGADWSVLASDGNAREYPVYDLEMRRRGSLDAPYGTNIPHPQLVPHPDGGWLLVTFDGTQYAEELLGYGGHGDVLVLLTSPPS